MTLYTGKSYSKDPVSLESPNLNLLKSIIATSDVKDSIGHWFSEAQRREEILYFSNFVGRELSGQILLHDINAHMGESLVGYHLFSPQVRGQGIGTQALRLLQSYVRHETVLEKLVIMTSRENLASQQIARKCEFQYVGPSREDPANGMVFEWHVPLGSG